MDHVAYALVIGVGATVLVDAWVILRKRVFHTPAPKYGLVGRWFAHLAQGRIRHDSISGSPAVRGELLIGWTAHYLVGVLFAAVLLSVWGLPWVRQPTVGPALIVGIGSVAAPFLVMQPGMGAGVAASRTPSPVAARIQTLVTHAVFGLGLYLAGWVCRIFLGP